MELTGLKNATDSQHKRLERELDLLRPSFTRANYVALLRRFYGFHCPWETAVEAQLDRELPGFFAPRRKLRNLESDLLYLGSTAADLRGISRRDAILPLTGVASALGSMYVIEGSSLGGRILTRHFGQHLGVLPQAGCAFFAGYGESTGRMWSEFGALVAIRPPSEDGDMLSAAVATFEGLGQWLLNE